MREISLSQGKVALVDDDDYAKVLLRGPWCAMKHGQTYYAGRTIRKGESWTTEFMHQFISGYGRTDHIDRNGLNNQSSNLREATAQQNMRNQGPRGGSSLFKGVCWDKRAKKWKSAIRDYKKIHLGYFEIEQDAARAYDRAAREMFGEFAYLNFPGGEA